MISIAALSSPPTFLTTTLEHPLIFLAVPVSSTLHNPTHSPRATLWSTLTRGTPFSLHRAVMSCLYLAS